MIIPSKLKIGGHQVTIRLDQKLDGKNGESDFTKNEISICKSLPRSQQESTLIHEIFHFMNCTLSDTPLGHALHDSISEQLYQVLSDNNMLK